MFTNLSRQNYKYFIINFLFSSLVLSFIVGNLFINANVLLIIIFSLFFYNKELLNIKINIIDKILIIFFIYILLTGVINNFLYSAEDAAYSNIVLKKTILFFRFLFFYFTIRFLIMKNLINFKFFIIVCSILLIFVCFDIIYQYYFKLDIFGFEIIDPRRISGPFGDELIAGSFIQRFSLISIFLLPIYFKFKNKYLLYTVIFLFLLIFLISLVFSGNRIPMIFFVLSLLGILICERKFWKYILPLLILIPIILATSILLNKNIYYHFGHFKTKAEQIFFIFSKDNIITENEIKNEIENGFKKILFYTVELNGVKYRITNTHVKEFKTGFLAWKKNKFLGGGIKSFRKNCKTIKDANCSNHPHNYFLEILAELGLFSFLIVSYLFLFLFYKTFVKKYLIKSNLNKVEIITPFIFLFFTEIFPIKSTGSFFTTGNATYIFLIMSILVSLAIDKNKIAE